MARAPRPGFAPVLFDPEAWAEDLRRASESARVAALEARARLERDGQAVAELRACDAEGRDGTRLAGCVKVYLPAPAGPWGLVFGLGRGTAGGPVRLECLAFGARHPSAESRQPSVYAVAHHRLDGEWPASLGR